MKTSFSAFLLAVATLGVASCSQNEDPPETVAPVEPAGQPGYGEQVGKQIDQAVLDLQQRAREAETRLGDRLIEVGKAIKEDKQDGADGTE